MQACQDCGEYLLPAQTLSLYCPACAESTLRGEEADLAYLHAEDQRRAMEKARVDWLNGLEPHDAIW